MDYLNWVKENSDCYVDGQMLDVHIKSQSCIDLIKMNPKIINNQQRAKLNDVHNNSKIQGKYIFCPQKNILKTFQQMEKTSGHWHVYSKILTLLAISCFVVTLLVYLG